MPQDAGESFQQSSSTPAAGLFGLPAGGPTIAAAALIMGIALIAYAVRVLGRRPAPAPAAASPAPAIRVPSLAADMQELADRLAQEMDQRAARLEQLIAAADARLVELKSLPRRAARDSAAAPAASAIPPHDPAFAQIYALADAGATPVEIARTTGRPTGQVELILNLRRGSIAM
jgi:hypothetical protein